MPTFFAGDVARLQPVCEPLQFFLNFQVCWDESLALCGKAEARAVASADYLTAGRRAYDAGWIQSLRQQAEAVLACANRAAEHWHGLPSSALDRVHAFRLSGIGHLLKHDYSAAIEAYKRALNLHRSIAAESRDVAIGLNDLAEVEAYSGEFYTAEEHFREALRVARVVGYAEGVATLTSNLAALALNRADWPEAAHWAREALHLAEKNHRQQLIASNSSRLSQALIRQGKSAEAKPYAQRAVDICTRLRAPNLASAQAILAECVSALEVQPHPVTA